MTVSLVGDGPAVAAVRAALDDTTHDCTTRRPDTLDDSLTVVVGSVGDDRFERAHRAARETGARWLAVEVGGVGGRPVAPVDAAVSGFGPETACFDCLETRVRANQAVAGTVPGDPDPADDSDGDPVDASTRRLAGAVAGHEAVRLLDGDPSPAMGGVIELPYTTRELFVVPGCDCAPERSFDTVRGTENRDLQASLARAERAVDERLGLIHSVGEVESFPVPYYLASLADTSGFSLATASANAAGVDPDWNPAFMKALGEALERYAAGVYGESDLLRAREGDIDGTVPLSAFVLPETDREVTEWLPATALESGTRVAVPAERVLFPYETPGPTITTGLGLGGDGDSALLAGLTEIVERDAAILSWYSTNTPLGLAVEGERWGTLVGRARAEGLSVTATLLTQDVDVPVVGCAVHREGEWPRFAMGLACDLDPVDAACSAATEALQNWTELRSMGRADAPDAGGRIGHFASLPDSAREFTDPETTVPAGSVGVEASSDAVDELVRRVGAAGLTPYATRLTTPDLEALGFEAVRVLIPGAQPLFVEKSYFGERAEQVPRAMGFEPRLRREHHPYP